MGIARRRGGTGRVAAVVCLAAALLGLSTVCAAATVTIHLKDSSGIDLSRVSIALFPTEKPQRPPPQGMDFRWPTASTDSSGIAVFQNVPAGAWAVYVSVPGGRGYLAFELPGFPASPWGNPQVPSPRLTITNEAEKIALDVTVQRGDTVSLRLIVDRDPRPGGTVYMEEVATKVRYEGYINRGQGERLLPPGRWRLWLEPRPGQLLKTFEVDHEPVLEGASAVIETKGEGRRIDVDWSYVTPCQVTGRLAWDVGDSPPGTVVAHLVRAGDWLDEVQRRGGTVIDRIPGAYDRGSYTLFLLDGAWRLTVEGPRVLSSDPDHVDMQLAPGDEGSVDFFVKAKAPDGAERSILMVKVTSPDGTPLRKAHVAVWRLGEGGSGTGGGDDGAGRDDGKESSREPLMRAETGSDYPIAQFKGLPAGTYRIVAGHAEYREGRTVFENFRAKPGDPQLATVALRPGAEITAVVKDEKDAPARGIELRVARTGSPPESELDDEDLRKERELRSTVSDETGRMRVGGLDAGTYRLETVLTEQRRGTHFVRFEKAANPGDPLEVTLAEDEKIEVGIRLVPAASVSAHLACSDRGPFPEKIALRALPFPLDAEAEDPGPRREGVFARDDLVLTGREKDALFAGPLTAGTFAVALRPEAYDRWTFARGTEDPDRAVPATLEAGGTQDLGVITLDCGPTVRVEAEIQSQEPAPDLRDATLEAALRVLDAPAAKTAPENASTRPSRRESSSTSTRPLSPSQEAHAAFIRLRGAPEGSVALSLTIRHPYFVPSTIVVKEADLLLERGREAKARVKVPRLGGAIRFDPALGATVALITPTPDAAVDGSAIPPGAPAAAPSASPGSPPLPERRPLDEKARAIGILPGRYTVELFTGEDAAHRVAVWNDVVVEAGKTVVPPSPARASPGR